MNNNPQARSGLESQVASRVVRDPEFRRALLADPRSALQHELGVTIPNDVTVRVVEETASTFYLVLPPMAQPEGHELSSEELSSVAGGWTGGGCPTGGGPSCAGNIC